MGSAAAVRELNEPGTQLLAAFPAWTGWPCDWDA